jgi:hypothetical protein
VRGNQNCGASRNGLTLYYLMTLIRVPPNSSKPPTILTELDFPFLSSNNVNIMAIIERVLRVFGHSNPQSHSQSTTTGSSSTSDSTRLSKTSSILSRFNFFASKPIKEIPEKQDTSSQDIPRMKYRGRYNHKHHDTLNSFTWTYGRRESSTSLNSEISPGTSRNNSIATGHLMRGDSRVS